MPQERLHVRGSVREAGGQVPLGRPHAPLFVPLAAPPAPQRAASLIWPTAHATLAPRTAMLAAAPAEYWPSFAVLVALAPISLVLVPLKLEWRTT